MPNPATLRVIACCALAAAIAPALNAQPASDVAPEDVRKARAQERLERFGRGEKVAPSDLPAIDPALVERYRQTITVLAAEDMAGRAPGTEGIERAAQYIQDRFTTLGLDPIFDQTITAADGSEIVRERASYRQPFQRGSRTELHAASLAFESDDLTLDEDFSVLGHSGAGAFTGPVTFVGYSIVSGPGGYLGYPPRTDLSGRAVMLLRFEPMNDDGSSKWSSDGWSFAASLQAKLSAAARRNASAIILVTPPNADDPRVGRLENIDSTTGNAYDVPVIMITPELADRIVRAGDPEGRALDDLINRANNEGTVINLDDDVTIATNVNIEQKSILTDNVGALLPGRGDLANEYVVIGAHYDHVGRAEGELARATRSPDRIGEIHPGADDNASGTTGVLLAAELLADRYAQLPTGTDARSVVFLAFSAEESGLNGSRYFSDHPPVPADAQVTMLNMDMIGRLRDGRLEIGGTESSPDLDAIAFPHLEASGLAVSREIGRQFRGRSDHANFESEGIPNMFVFTGLHDEYHTADDTLDLINHEGGVRVTKLVADIAYDVATLETAPTHTDREPQRGVTAASRPTVRVGIVPADDPNGGFVIARLFDGTSAADAGLRQGDRVLTWNGEPIESIDAWSPVLLEHKPGDVVTLTIQRDGEEQTIEMTLKSADG
ncbi:MAG: M28 family peptidase [Phycisphaerales bacterium]